MGSLITAPVTFNGTSKYAQDLQQVITRAVRMASLPLQILQNQQADTSDKLTSTQSLQSVISKLSDAVDGLSSSKASTLTATVSNPAVIRVTSSSGALPGTYTVEVTDAGSYSTAMNSDAVPKVTDPNSKNISPNSSFTLTVAATTYKIH